MDHVNVNKAWSACAALIATIDATGGLIEDPQGELVPHADQEWLDLASAYLIACEAMGEQPQIDREGGEDG